MSLASPLAESFSILKHVNGRFPVRHRNSFGLALAAVSKRFATCRLKRSSVTVIDFEIEHAAGDQADHHAVVVNAVAAEHRSRSDITEVAEHVE